MKMICKCCGIVDKPHKCYKKQRANTDKNREDKKIYKTYRWQQKRIEILKRFNYICLWSYFIEGKVVIADNVHHITEIITDSSKAYDDDNLIPLCKEAHKIVHELYKLDTKKTQEVLRQFICEYECEYKKKENLLGKYIENNIPPYYFLQKR